VMAGAGLPKNSRNAGFELKNQALRTMMPAMMVSNHSPSTNRFSVFEEDLGIIKPSALQSADYPTP